MPRFTFHSCTPAGLLVCSVTSRRNPSVAKVHIVVVPVLLNPYASPSASWNVTTLRAKVHRTTARERLLLNLASGFGGIALLLASVGLYGIFAYAVARRRREIGVRLALGAQRAAVVRSVLYEAVALAAAGIAAGIPLSLAAGYLLRSFLFGVTAYDVLTLAGAGSALATVALLAAYGPAQRASNIDPVVALRYE